MVLSVNDRHLIRALREDKNMSVNRIVQEFPNRKWHKSTVARFLKRLKATGSIERRPGSGSKPSVIPPELTESVLKMIRSKDPDTGMFYSIRKIALITGASRKMVTKIASTDPTKAPAKKKITAQARLKQRLAKQKRLELCNNLLQRFNDNDGIKKIWFSGERCFTLEKPKYVRTDIDVDQAFTLPSKKSKSKKQAAKKGKKDQKKKKKKARSKKKVEEEDEEDEDEEEEIEEKARDEVKVNNKDKQPQLQETSKDTTNECEDNLKNSCSQMVNMSHIDSTVGGGSDIPGISKAPLATDTMSTNNPNCDMSSANNDVMNLINIYVSNPLNFVSNPNTSNYLQDPASCAYNVPNPSNEYCAAAKGHGYVPANPHHHPHHHHHQGGYPVPNMYNYNNANPVNTNSVPVPKTSNYVGGPVTNVNNKNVVPATKKAPVPANQVSNSVIVSLAVSIGGKTDPIFVDRPSGYLSAECYRREVLARVLPTIKQKTPDFIFMQDKSTAHQSQNTVKYLQEHCPDFIKPEEWPPGCPQLHPIEYFVWKKLQSLVYRGDPIKSVDELKAKIVKCWSDVSQASVDAALAQWPNKLKAAVKRAKE